LFPFGKQKGNKREIKGKQEGNNQKQKAALAVCFSNLRFEKHRKQKGYHGFPLGNNHGNPLGYHLVLRLFLHSKNNNKPA